MSGLISAKCRIVLDSCGKDDIEDVFFNLLVHVHFEPLVGRDGFAQGHHWVYLFGRTLQVLADNGLLFGNLRVLDDGLQHKTVTCASRTDTFLPVRWGFGWPSRDGFPE